jgi:hypothetical protein
MNRYFLYADEGNKNYRCNNFYFLFQLSILYLFYICFIFVIEKKFRQPQEHRS